MPKPVSTSDLVAIFESSPILLSRLTPLLLADDTPERIALKAREIIASLDEAERIAALNAHPRIGASTTLLSDLSKAEQGDAADARTLRELAELNDAYERRFGFRFVVFVNGRSKPEILPVLRERLARTREQELAAGIDEYLRIANARLQRAPR